MALHHVEAQVQQRPILLLIVVFIGWKLLLLTAALLSPGIGYDTSTDLFLASKASDNLASGSHRWAPLISRLLASKLVRWDSFYFIAIADRGYLFEQEWAFTLGFPALVAKIATSLPKWHENVLLLVAVAILVANLSHLFSVIVLYFLGKKIIWPGSTKPFPLIAAILHVFAPAGMFLCSPYGESLFALLSFSGYYCHLNSLTPQKENSSRSYVNDVQLLISGVLFGFAATVRSNGIFNGVIFLYDLFQLLWDSRSIRDIFSNLQHLASVIIAGLFVAIGFAFPQYLAYMDICVGHESTEQRRPWCKKFLPSVYTFVQEHYWGVGFLRYWTISNIPLFVLALPMLTILLVSATWALRLPRSSRAHGKKEPAGGSGTNLVKEYLIRLALPQMLVAALAITNFHVQVITRIASAYPLPYFWIATRLTEDRESSSAATQWTVRWMIMYALIQGGLFVSFLPPA